MPSPSVPRRGFLLASGLVATVGIQTEATARATESPEDAVSFDPNRCDTVEIEGAFETVSMSAHTYDSDGFDTFRADFGPVDGTTTLPPDDFEYFPNGLNGYLIPSVRLVDSEGDTAMVENPHEDDCYDRIRPDHPSVEFVDAEPADETIETTFRVENPNDGTLNTQTTVDPQRADGDLPFAYEPGPTEFTLQWQPETESQELTVTVEMERFGYEESPSAETPPASEIRSTETEAFDPEIRLSCHTVRIDAESYDSVELTFADGTTVGFDDGYSGSNEFGFRGDGRIQDDSDLGVDEFYGPIEQVTITSGETTETDMRGDDTCIFEDLVFECDSARHRQADDTRMAFVDGSFKMWDAPADPEQERFGSPGRIIESITEESGDITAENPNQDCEPGEYATVFDCTEVTITDAEFEVEPTFDLVRLNFDDETTQEFGDLVDGPHFTAPETFAGNGDHEGKIIESVEIEKLGGDIFFRLVNPDVDCEAVSSEESNPEKSDDNEPDTAEADEAELNESGPDGSSSDDRGSNESESGGSSSDDGFDGDDDGATHAGPDRQPERSETHTDGDTTQPADDESGLMDTVPWWGWAAGIGGAGGAAYAVGRTFGDEDEGASSDPTSTDISGRNSTAQADSSEKEVDRSS